MLAENVHMLPVAYISCELQRPKRSTFLLVYFEIRYLKNCEIESFFISLADVPWYVLSKTALKKLFEHIRLGAVGGTKNLLIFPPQNLFFKLGQPFLGHL